MVLGRKPSGSRLFSILTSMFMMKTHSLIVIVSTQMSSADRTLLVSTLSTVNDRSRLTSLQSVLLYKKTKLGLLKVHALLRNRLMVRGIDRKVLIISGKPARFLT